MNISKFKIVWKYLFGGTSSVVEYVLGVLNKALSSIGETSKEKVQACLNTAIRVLAVLTAIKWLVPTKWQTAYGNTIFAVQGVVDSLSDLEITKDELTTVADRCKAALDAWKSPDDDTCVDGSDL